MCSAKYLVEDVYSRANDQYFFTFYLFNDTHSKCCGNVCVIFAMKKKNLKTVSTFFSFLTFLIDRDIKNEKKMWNKRNIISERNHDKSRWNVVLLVENRRVESKIPFYFTRNRLFVHKIDRQRYLLAFWALFIELVIIENAFKFHLGFCCHAWNIRIKRQSSNFSMVSSILNENYLPVRRIQHSSSSFWHFWPPIIEDHDASFRFYLRNYCIDL